MRIGIDIRSLMDRQYSGVNYFTLNLVKEILKSDQENKYILYYNSFKDISDRLPDFKKFNSQVEIVRTKYPNKLFNYFLQKILHWPKLDKAVGGVDVFLCPHLNFINLSQNCRGILVVHDLSFLRYPEFFSLRKNVWHHLLNIKKLVKRFTKIVAVSENTKRDLVELLGVEKDRITVVYPGLEDYADFKFSDDILNKYSLKKDYLLYLGTIEPRKNIQAVIQAYNLFRDDNPDIIKIDLVLAGGKGWKSEQIYLEWEKSKYKQDIRFLGYVDNNDKIALIKQAKLFLYPSFYEGFGFPPLEAMSYNVPVITSNVSSLPETCGEAVVVVDPYNIEALSLSIKEMIFDAEIRNHFIRKGKEQANLFNWDKTGLNFLKIINEI